MCPDLIFISLFLGSYPLDPILKPFVYFFNCQEKKVKKLYRALAAAPMPIGIVTHYMRPVNIAPRLISEGIISIKHSGDS